MRMLSARDRSADGERTSMAGLSRNRRVASRRRPSETNQELRVSGNASADDRILNILTAEVSDVTRAMREFLLSADRFINFAGTIAIGAFVLGFLNPDKENSGLLFIFAPYPLGLAFGF